MIAEKHPLPETIRITGSRDRVSFLLDVVTDALILQGQSYSVSKVRSSGRKKYDGSYLVYINVFPQGDSDVR